MTTIVIHPATKVCLDYGGELSRERGFIIEANGQMLKFDGARSAREELARWESTLANHERETGTQPNIRVSLGEYIVRRFDMNPHGLM